MNKLFNNETCPGRIQTKEPAIHLNTSGLSFNNGAVKEMKLKVGDRLSFELVKDRFFVFTDSENGIPVTGKKDGMIINRASLRNALQMAVGKPRFRMKLEKQTTYRWELILIG